MKKPRSKKKASPSEPPSASPARASASAAPTAQPTVVPAKSSQAAPEVKVAINSNSSASAASKPAAPSRPASAPSRDRIAARAFALYAERGYRDGRALEDWLEAEREVLASESPSKST